MAIPRCSFFSFLFFYSFVYYGYDRISLFFYIFLWLLYFRCCSYRMGYFFVRVHDVTGLFFGCRNGSPVADALLSYCVHFITSILITGSSGSTVVLVLCIQVEANTEFGILHDANSCLRTRQWENNNNIVENNCLVLFCYFIYNIPQSSPINLSLSVSLFTLLTS